MPLGLFQGYGVELEYMIVDRRTLDVLPVCDRVLEAVAGKIVSDVELGATAWSNELVLHVIELKTNGPARSLSGLADLFQADVRRINRLLEPLDGLLMPTAMHPWMDPDREARIWPHEWNAVYHAFDRIFDCRGHGWSNLQSTHLNLPFAGDAEFGRLHAAIRLVLPLLPALAASSPLVDGRLTGLLDSRLDRYRRNAVRIPAVTGRVIPERVYSRRSYQEDLLQPLYRAIAPLDPEGILQFEWVNARGAIARFDRDAIEIRVLDIQECPLADLAVAAAVSAAIRAHVEERWVELSRQQAWEVEPLARILEACVDRAERAVIRDQEYLQAFGFAGASCEAGELWRHVVECALPAGNPGSREWRPALDQILERGSLASRILLALGPEPAREHVAEVYRELCACLAEGRLL